MSVVNKWPYTGVKILGSNHNWPRKSKDSVENFYHGNYSLQSIDWNSIPEISRPWCEILPLISCRDWVGLGLSCWRCRFGNRLLLSRRWWKNFQNYPRLRTVPFLFDSWCSTSVRIWLDLSNSAPNIPFTFHKDPKSSSVCNKNKAV